MAVDLSNWKKYFSLNSGSGSTAYIEHLSSTTNPSKGFGQVYPVPNVPPEHYGNNVGPKMVIIAMGMDIGGYGTAGDFRFKIWDNSGTSKYTSDRLRTKNTGTTANGVTRFNLNIYNGESDDDLGNTDTSIPPVLITDTTLNGTTSYRFGAYVTASSNPVYDVSYQLQTNSLYQVNQDLSLTTTGAFTIDNTAASKSLIGRIYYILIPTAPTNLIEDINVPKARQIGLKWTASSSDGGDPDGFQYVVEYQKLGQTYWITYDFANTNSITVTGLLDGTNYLFRVKAVNKTQYFLTSSDGLEQAASEWAYSGAINTLPIPSWGDYSLPSSAEAYKIFNEGVSAWDATSYTVTSGSLPPGLSLNNATGQITGSPNSLGTYNFTIQAANAAGSVSQSFTLTITGSVNIMDSSGNPVSGTVKVYNGSAWVAGTVYVWDLTYTGTGGTHWRQIK